MTSPASDGRRRAIEVASNRAPRIFTDPESSGAKASEIFGTNTFDQKAMAERLPKDVYRSLVKTVHGGHRLDQNTATVLAHAVKEWAIEKGATHYCHWFQPNTGATAEKHDAFLTTGDDGQPIERFDASQLIQSEPDASSFPSGGLRATFEARGYTAWDPSSPIFVMDSPNGKTLCLPSVFVSYHGQALDKKTPLLRSDEYLARHAEAVLRLFGQDGVRVFSTLGPEQEYFLIDEAFYVMRPDLMACGRTLIGAKGAKGQELEDQYFGSIKPRILAFMQEVEHELFKLGVPMKTRHNEVAPAQFEAAPVYESVSVAADHNQLTMEIMRRVAERHHFALLLHEKPFGGVNGSGKHNNWSLATSDGENLLNPGATPEKNLRFLVFLMATLKAVHRHQGALRAAIASAGNDHRLGANEAPPAIISAFIGDALTRILDQIESGKVKGATAESQVINLGVSKLPELARDNTDRNRTSPFAFTGNKFEFRAVGSSHSSATPMATLNAAVGEALEEMAKRLKKAIAATADFDAAVMSVIREYVTETKAIRFEGNGYSEEWRDEAARRGLLNLAKTPEALKQLVAPATKKLFTRSGVYRSDELESRYHLELERYIKDLEIEVASMDELVVGFVLPAVYKHQGQLASSIEAVLDVLDDEDDLLAPQVEELRAVARLIAEIKARLEAMRASVRATHGKEPEAVARQFADRVVPAMEALRDVCDRAESEVDDALWPLPKYREMLFVV